MFFGHWEYTDGFKAGGFSFASDQSSLAVIRNLFSFFFSLPSTAMPREPYAKIRERKRGRKGKRKGTFVIARIVPLPGSAGYSNALNRQATREIGSDSGKHRDTRSLRESKNMPISSFFSSFFFFFFV